ncbi:hypothetical protein JQ544_20765 [Bradyrhizobium diazoefficiens]|uniref:hypothetical protein n=1 Tax=Bradyrhizobium tunisiense TaxID=3278709 RepID=UPI001BA8254C|nr:hypothetical protein [Bradyrhizobium diazoefficiens]MBR0813978.1 hypothetical protein [Bradyrhizobium diazoefficiens]
MLFPFKVLASAMRVARTIAKWIVGAMLLVLAFLFLANLLLFPTYRHLPSRALAAESPSCRDAKSPGWDALATTNNREWAAIDQRLISARKLSCSIQHHRIPETENGKPIEYDVAFLEFQEDGKPYALRLECGEQESCVAERGVPIRRQSKGQLEALVDHLKTNTSNYVLVFIHGWRHDASIGDSDVANLRMYAAQVARFISDRAAVDNAYKDMRVTAVYIGWRGARTDENWLARNFPGGASLGTASAILTLFDRKPVSEAIAPSALSALRAIENTLGLDAYSELPRKLKNKMIIFGHSLGGNMLMTALGDDLVKKVALHEAGSYMQPVLGDLVVLINPASEASKWTAIQRTLWRRLALINGERRRGEAYEASQSFFRDDQRPIFLSVTAARNWPPGGRQQLDCSFGDRVQNTENAVVQQLADYDWATHDMFPAFKGDLRPLADRIELWGTQLDPSDECVQRRRSVSESLLHPARTIAILLSELIRVLPFMQTDPEQTQTIGNLDPPRSPRGNLRSYGATMKPFGTTHEIRASDKQSQLTTRKMSTKPPTREIPLDYLEASGPEAACSVALGWLSRTKAAKIEQEAKADGKARKHYATNWDTYDLKPSEVALEGFPALRFIHGFDVGGISPPTRANDPFWNIRAFDTALAEHDGYMLTSFICSMNQLVLDDVTRISR